MKLSLLNNTMTSKQRNLDYQMFKSAGDGTRSLMLS